MYSSWFNRASCRSVFFGHIFQLHQWERSKKQKATVFFVVSIHKHTETIFTHELQPGKSGVLVYCPKVIFHHIYHKTNYLHESHSHFWMHIWFRQRTHIHFVGITTITRATLPWYSEHDTHLVRVCCQVKDSYLSFPHVHMWKQRDSEGFTLNF